MTDQSKSIIDIEYEWLFISLSRSLNKIHNTNYDEKFWRKAFYFGLKRFVGIAYYHYYDINRDKKSYSNNNLILADDFERLLWLIRDTDEYYSVANRVSKTPDVSNLFDYEVSFQQFEYQKETKSRALLLWLIQWPAIYLARTLSIGCFFTTQTHLKIWFKSLGKIIPFKLKRFNSIDQNIQIEKRVLLNNYLSDDLNQDTNIEFRIFLINFISTILPTMYLESFDEAFSFYKNQALKFKKVKYILSENWFSDAQISFFIAIMHELNIKFYAIDHNGPTVYFKKNVIAETYKIVDRLYTQGWESLNQSFKNKIIQSSSLFSNFRVAHSHINKSMGDKIVFFVAPAYSKRSLESDIYFYQGAGAPIYLKNQRDFLSGLTQDLQRNIVYRTAPIVLEKPYAYKTNIDFLIKNSIPMDDLKQKNGVIVLKSTKLAIYDYCATGIFEAMLMRKPFIVIVDRKLISFSDKYIHLIEELYELEIFISNASNAAKVVNRIADNPKKWWLEKNRNLKALAFAKIFVDSSDKLINQLVDFSKNKEENANKL